MAVEKQVIHAYADPDFGHRLNWAGITVQDDGQVIIWWSAGNNGAWLKADELRAALDGAGL